MLKLLFLLILMPTLFSASIRSQTAPPLETGVSQTLAKWRAANYSDVRYKLNITLEKGAPLMKGKIEISVKLTDEGAKNDLILDWRTTQFANDKDLPFANVIVVNDKTTNGLQNIHAPNSFTSNEHLIVSKKFLKAGANTIEINFASPIKTSGAAITRYVDKEDGAEYIYSLFVPSDASTAFPVFDQPDLKARFTLGVSCPQDWKVVTNSVLNLKDYQQQHTRFWDGFPLNLAHKIQFYEETKPISTYVFAFAAGEFTEFDEDHLNVSKNLSGNMGIKGSAEWNTRARLFCANRRLFSRPSRRKTISFRAPTSFFTKPRTNGSATR